MAETKWTNQNGGNWNDAANWDNGIPDSTKSAIINAASFAANGKTITVNATANMLNFDCSAAAYTFTLSNAAYAFNVYGDLKDSTKRVNGFSSTGYLYLKGSSNIYSNGATQGLNRIYFDGVGATFTNQDDWNVGSTDFYHANGEWITNSKVITILGNISSVTGIKTFTFTNSIINCNSLDFRNGTVSFNEINSTINLTRNLNGNRKSFNNVNFIGTSSLGMAIDQVNTFVNLSGISGNNFSYLTIYANQTVTGTLTLSGNNAQNYRLLVASNTIGTPRTITCNGSIIASNVDFRDITLAGTANRDLSAISGGSGDCGGNSGITFTPAIDCYIKYTSGAMNVSDATKWVTTDGGITQARVPLMQDRAWGTANSFTGAATINMNCPRIGSIDLSGVNQAVTFSLANAIECYGNYVLGNNIIHSTSYQVILMGRGNFELNLYNSNIYRLNINCIDGIYNNRAPFFATDRFSVLSGTFKINDNDVKFYVIYPAVTGIIYLGTKTIEITSISDGLGVLFSSTSTVYPESSTFILTASQGSASIAFTGGGKTFNKVIFSGQHTGNFIISGNNTFNELIIEKGRKVQITGASTQAIKKITNLGVTADKTTITSTNTTPYNIVTPNDGYLQIDNCNLSYCNAVANRFYAGKNSVNAGNNTNVLWKYYLADAIMTIQKIIRL